MSRGMRKAMFSRDHPGPSLSQQCDLLSISRSSFYYAPSGGREETLTLMRRIDELFLKYPFYGSQPDGASVTARRHLRWPSPGTRIDALDGIGSNLSGPKNR